MLPARASPTTRSRNSRPAYVYLLGLYLGDGCISKHARGVFKLGLAFDVRYPEILGRTVTAIHDVRGGVVGCQLRPENCIEVYS